MFNSTVFCFTSTLIGFVAVVLCCSLIHYENNVNDRYRTLVNGIYSLILGYVSIVIAIGTAIIVLHTAFSSELPTFVCYVDVFAMCFGITAVCLALNEAILVQYVYACHLGTFGLLNEQFLLHFIKCCNVFMGCVLSALAIFGNMAPPRPFVWCTGLKTEDVFRPRVFQGKAPYAFFCAFFTLILHVALKLRIRRHQFRNKQKRPKNILTFRSVVFVLLLSASSALVALFMDLSTSPRLPWVRVAMNFIVGWGLPIHSLWRHPQIRDFYRSRLTHIYL